MRSRPWRRVARRGLALLGLLLVGGFAGQLAPRDPLRVVAGDRLKAPGALLRDGGIAVLGTDGFGYRWDGTKHAKVPQIGTIEIGDDVEIGSCSCVDRAKFSVTRIGRGTKLCFTDNQDGFSWPVAPNPPQGASGHDYPYPSVTTGHQVSYAEETRWGNALKSQDHCEGAGPYY